MDRRWLVAMIFLGACCGCRSMPAGGPAAEVTSTDARTVYETVLRSAYVHEPSGVFEGTKRFVVDPNYHWRADEGWSHEDRPRGVPQDAWQSWYAASRRGGRLPRDLEPGLPLSWFSNAEFHRLPESGGMEMRWPAFHKRFPGSSGHIQLSRIGWSRDGTTALVYGFVGSGSLSASGDLFVLRRTADGWRLMKSHNFAMA